ncbi:putative esterase of the alpha-beta hydrolase superfamily [Thioflavicoccus mobilis 8321]|uniref:Putative esterase of the alpha-beta hydrolase superfamily n=1 Tax=Thioflavicoccus mobilis 8321 TaxID=765912 RepID=L0H354_9GAMM|nr:patatin-like phospholipase family protein [Thioflavicoccus mobilis]AGA92090.1 putative esterase of the alpha-beta hydrolase superfamily [Thioflavicoccus mobilis 8321]
MKRVESIAKTQFAAMRLQAPAVASPPPPRTFDLGLVTAGAVSGGAYQAGVMDFLVEALDRWYAAKAAGEDVPQHDVRVRVVSGASAGGINSALLAIAASWGFQPRRLDGEPSVWGEAARDKPSPFHSIWVDGIDIADLLTTDDLDSGRLPSLLNAGYLEKVLVPQALRFEGVPITDEQRPFRGWLADPLPVLLTVTNLKGVPYSLAFNTGANNEYQADYQMVLHKDFMAFKVEGVPGTPTPQELNGLIDVPAPNSVTSVPWVSLGSAALATAAFPVGLAPIALERPYADYDYRIHYTDAQTQEVRFIRPLVQPERYQFANLDGGVMNNEPFDLARAVLYGRDAGEVSDGAVVDRGVLLLEAFPRTAELFDNLQPNIVQSVMRMMNSQIEQARFKMEDLIFAARDDVFSRFLIQPIRPDAGDPEKLTLASAPLGAFFGFFSRDFREHDFQLGRRNCQDFLRHRLKLPPVNPVLGDAVTADADGLVPLIPLVGPCAKEEPIPEWPAGRFAITATLSRAIEKRLDKVGDYLIQRYLDDNWLVRRVWLGVPLVTQGVKKKLLDYIDRTLKSAAQDIDDAR